MTQQELLNLGNLKVAEVKPNMFLHIHANEGYMITPYFDGMDIKNYESGECYYMPIENEYPDYRVITSEEDKVYSNLRDETLRKENNQ
jgi:hypothetical protein